MTTIRDGLVAAGRSLAGGRRVGVLGAGGVARGLVAGLDAEGASVVVWNRNPRRRRISPSRSATGSSPSTWSTSRGDGTST